MDTYPKRGLDLRNPTEFGLIFEIRFPCLSLVQLREIPCQKHSQCRVST